MTLNGVQMLRATEACDTQVFVSPVRPVQSLDVDGAAAAKVFGGLCLPLTTCALHKHEACWPFGLLKMAACGIHATWVSLMDPL